MLVRYVRLFENYTIIHNKYTLCHTSIPQPVFLEPVACQWHHLTIYDNDLYLLWLKMKPSSVIWHHFIKGTVKYSPVPASLSQCHNHNSQSQEAKNWKSIAIIEKWKWKPVGIFGTLNIYFIFWPDISISSELNTRKSY